MFVSSTIKRVQKTRLTTIFVLSLYSLVALSSAMLMLSEGYEFGIPPQVFTIPVLIVAYFLVDYWKLVAIPWWVAGVLGLLAMGMAFSEVSSYIQFQGRMPVMHEDHFLELVFAGSHLLVYLTWIVLFLRKTNQQYWWLWGLCVLQIAVGASQSTESLYGVLLSGYLFMAVWTLSVFSLLQGQQQFDRAQQTAEFTGLENAIRSERDHEADLPRKAGDAAEGSSPQTLLYLWRQPSRAIGNVQRDPSASWIDSRFLWGVVSTCGLAFVLALLFFLLIPRHPAIWKRNQANSSTGPLDKRQVGFSRELKLGDIGEILESTNKVMEIRLTDYQTDQPVDMQTYAFHMGLEEPLFRGMSANQYVHGRWGAWETNDWSNRGRRFDRRDIEGKRLVKQQILLEPIDPEILFAMPPVVYGVDNDSEEPIRVEQLSSIIKRDSPDHNNNPISYTILSEYPPNRRKRGELPLTREEAAGFERRLPFYRTVAGGLNHLRDLAKKHSGWAETPRPDALERALRLEGYFKNSGEFQYTLNADVTDESIDPLEDFLVNRKMGHCEYFASALALMLREVEVPSRLVSGFKGGQYNPTTGLFEVEERHAHAWVEAYIEGKWIILDPTPAGRAESVESVGFSPGRFNDIRNLFRELWSKFIVGLNDNKQRQLLEPIKELFAGIGIWLRDSRTHLVNFLKGLKEQLVSPERWISWQGGLVTFVLLCLLSAGWWLFRAAERFVASLRERYLDPDGIAQTVAFYEQFRRICALAGLSRKASETPKEFANQVSRRYRELFSKPEWGQFPGSLVTAYYDVRYGSQILNAETIRQLEEHLARLETVLTEQAES